MPPLGACVSASGAPPGSGRASLTRRLVEGGTFESYLRWCCADLTRLEAGHSVTAPPASFSGAGSCCHRPPLARSAPWRVGDLRSAARPGSASRVGRRRRRAVRRRRRGRGVRDWLSVLRPRPRPGSLRPQLRARPGAATGQLSCRGALGRRRSPAAPAPARQHGAALRAEQLPPAGTELRQRERLQPR